ncbi:MAG: glycosyltransferase, partial [Candidatus Micrarchaeota archaeon]|nr:glycosyltransferase [Candidatus Micrarchaeota archaeon]
KVYHFNHRLLAEQAALSRACAIIVSSNNEKNVQYAGYAADSRKFFLIPPGVNIRRYRHFHIKRKDAAEKGVLSRFRLGLARLPQKPWIFALSRLDARKNLLGMVQAYVNDDVLRTKTNLVFSPGVLDDLSAEQEKIIDRIRFVLSRKARDRQVLVLGEHLSADEVGALYRLAAKKRGVFVNTAFVEPFGLTTLEAMASGLPVAVTQNGGPRDVISPGENGLLFNPDNERDIADRIKTVLFEKGVWERLSENGYRLAREKYAWKACAQKELALFQNVLGN